MLDWGVKFSAALVRLIWGNEVDRALRPVLAVMLVGSAAFSAGSVFLGIWAVDRLGATSQEVGVAYLGAAVLSIFAGYLGGHASDHLGRRPLILFGWAILAASYLAYAFVGDHKYLGLGLMMFAGVGDSIGIGADQAMIADLVPPERHEAGYAATRVAANLGIACGPPLGGLLLIGRHWPVMFTGVTVMALVALAIAYRYLPRGGAYKPADPPERGSFGVIRRDTAFLLFLLSSVLAYLVYVGYETVLPIAAVKTYGLAPSTWGFIVVIAPILVAVFQLRVTSWAGRFPSGPKLVAAMLLMGGGLLFLLWSGSVAMFVWVMIVFVIGEMLWVPTSQAIVAGLAPEDVRGAYMGAFGSTSPVAFTLGPFIGLQLRGAYGTNAAWYFFAAASVVAAASGAAAVRGATQRRQDPPRSADQERPSADSRR
jgi:predicted MFS family arabinose efflux permease